MAKEEVILDFKVEAKDSITSIENLTKANKALREERKKLNLESKQGQARAQEINKQLDANTDKIKQNSSALEKQRLNIGNYGGALDKLVPGLGATANGFSAMTKGALAFIATPIGAVIGALGLALGALSAYFKGSEEGQNNFNKIVKVGTVVLGNLLDIVRDFGGAIFKVFTGDFKGAAESLSESFEGLKNIVSETNEEITKGLAIEDLRAETDVLERQLIVLEATNKARIADLRLKAEDRSLNTKEREDALNEALRLQNELSDKGVEVAKNRLEIKREENKLSDSTKEDLREEAELEAALFLVQEDRSKKSREIAIKAQTLRKEGIALLEKELKLLALAEERRLKLAEINAKVEEDKVLSAELGATQIEEIDNKTALSGIANTAKLLKARVDATKKEAAASKKASEDEQRLDALTSQAKIQNAVNVLSVTSGLLKEGSIAAKAAAIAVTTAQTISAATAALAPPPVGAGPLFGPILAAVTSAVGLANVGKIAGLTFAAGGGSFMTKGPTHLVVGDNPGGVERVDVTPISGKGKTTVGRGMIKLAGGGSVVANGMSSKIDQNFGSTSSPKVVLTYSEFKEFMGGIDFKESLTTA